jgi:hypothetical protein
MATAVGSVTRETVGVAVTAAGAVSIVSPEDDAPHADSVDNTAQARPSRNAIAARENTIVVRPAKFILRLPQDFAGRDFRT